MGSVASVTVNDRENLSGVPDIVRLTPETCNTGAAQCPRRSRDSSCFTVEDSPSPSPSCNSTPRSSSATVESCSATPRSTTATCYTIQEESEVHPAPELVYTEKCVAAALKKRDQLFLPEEIKLVASEQQCSFGWAKLRQAGTKRLMKLKETLEIIENKVDTEKFLSNVSDLDSAFEQRMAAKAERRRKTAGRKVEWGKRKRRNTAKARTDHHLVRKVTPAEFSRTKCVQSIYTPVRDFAVRPSKCNLVFDKNRNVLTKEKALKKLLRSKQVKALDRKLSILACEKSRLLERLDSVETEGKQCSPVLVKRLDSEINTLNKKYQTLSARRHQVLAPTVSLLLT